MDDPGEELPQSAGSSLGSSFESSGNKYFGCLEGQDFIPMPSCSSLSSSFHSYTSKELVSPSKYKKQILKLQKKVWKNKKTIERLSDLVSQLEEKNMISSQGSEVLKDKFSGLSLALFENEIMNNNQSGAREYSEEIKRFALTLQFYSPRGYEFLRY